MKNYVTLSVLLTGFTIMVNAQLNVEFVGQLTYDANMSNVWGWTDPDGDEYVIAGTYDGTSLVDITDPTTPVELQFIDGDNSTWRQIATWDDYAYVVNETGGGLLCIDLSSLPGTCDYNFSDGGIGLVTSHQVWADENGVVYVFGSNLYGGATIMLDATTDPLDPTFLGTTDTWYVHHGYARGDTLWESNIYEGFFSVWDISDKESPELLATHTTPGLFTHNVVLNDAGNYLFSTDEITNGSLGAYDVSDLSDIQYLGEFRATPGTTSIPHYAWTKGQYVTTAWYRDGLVITDVSNPNYMIKTGWYDTSPFSGDGFNGAWGVYPYFESGIIAVTDIEEGLFLLSPTYTLGCRLEGTITDAITSASLFGVDVEITADPETAVTSNLSGYYITGLAEAGDYTVTFSKSGYEPLTISDVSLENGITTDLDVALTPLTSYPFTGQVIDAATGEGIEGADVLFQGVTIDYTAVTNADGYFTLSVIEDTYNIYGGKWGYITKLNSGIAIEDADSLIIGLNKGYYDDFLFENDWTESSTATSGDWVKDVPVGTEYGPGYANTDADVSDDFGELCFMTGNGGGSSGTDDVDDGTVTLTSPVFNLSGYSNPYIRFKYWWFNNGGFGSPDDTLKLVLSNGSTTATIIIDEGLTTLTLWDEAEYKIADYILPTDNMQAQFITSDFAVTGHLVEAAIDKFFVFDSITVLPVADFTQSTTDVCAGESVSFTDMSELATAWEWYFEGGTPSTSSLANPVITYTTPGVYDVTLIAENVLGNDLLTYSDLITVYALPELSVSAGVGEATVSISGGAAPYSILWSNGATTETVTGLPVGDYTVTVTDANGCSATAEVTVTQPSAIQYPQPGVEISVYPNPVHHYFNVAIQTENNYANGVIQITDVQGKQVLTTDLQPGSTTQIYVASLAAGVYNCAVILDADCVARFNVMKVD